MIPSILYLIQNNLQYYSASKLDAVIYQITNQMKIITTAIFSIIILKRTLFKHQWISIFMLTVGIGLVQFPTGKNSSSKEVENIIHDKFLGIIAIATACILSGMAGVYLEKILKNSKVTLWARNVQLSLFSIIPGYIIGVFFLDYDIIKKNGFFGGYTRWTVLTILLHAFRGMIVAVVVKYANNILKSFATSFSIILSCKSSSIVFNFNMTYIFMVGSALVMYATSLYAKPIKKLKENNISYLKFEEEANLKNIYNNYLKDKS